MNATVTATPTAVAAPAAGAPAAPAAATPAAAPQPVAPRVAPSRLSGNRPAPGTSATTAKVYGTTAGASGSRSTAALQAAADAARATPAAATAPIVTETAAPVTAPPGAPAGETPALVLADETAAAAADTATTETETAAAETPTEETPAEQTMPAAEFARRMARLANQERRISEEKRAFAEERTKHQAALERVSQMEKAGEIAKRDPVGFLSRMWGVKPQEIVDALLADQAKPAGQRVEDAQSETAARIAKLEKDLAAAAESTKAQQAEAARQTYVSATVAPIVRDTARFPFLNDELGASAAEHVYLTMEANWKRNPSKPPPSPETVAVFIEKHFRDKAARAAQLLNGGAAVTQTATPKKVATPPAPKPVAAQPAPAVQPRRPTPTGKSYTSQTR